MNDNKTVQELVEGIRQRTRSVLIGAAFAVPSSDDEDADYTVDVQFMSDVQALVIVASQLADTLEPPVDESEPMTPKQAHERIYRLLRTYPRTSEDIKELQQLEIDYPEVYEAAKQSWLDSIPF